MTKNRLLRWGIIILSVYLILTTIVSIIDLWRASDKLTRRQRNLAALEAEFEQLSKQKNLVEDPSYLEKVARDQLGLSKPGEETVIVSEELLKLGINTASPDATPNWKKWVKLLI